VAALFAVGAFHGCVLHEFHLAPAEATPDGGDAGVDAAGADAAATCPGPTTPCGDTQADPHHCGACGHDCLGGACVGGQCQPVVLASEQPDPLFIAVDPAPCGAGNVFWGTIECSNNNPETGDIRLAKKDGTGARTISQVDCVTGLVASETHVLWGGYTDVVAASLDGTNLETVASDPNLSAYLVALLGNKAYWEDTFGGVISTNDLSAIPCGTNCARGVPGRAAMTAIQGLAVDTSGIYWTTFGDPGVPNGGVWVSVDGGAPKSLALDQNVPHSLALGTDRIYWTADGKIFTVPKAGGTAQILVEEAAQDLARNGSSLFWARTDGAIRTSDLLGKAQRTLATGTSRPWAIAVDDVAVYWASRATGPTKTDGAVMRVVY
jgi:hypothetical protein